MNAKNKTEDHAPVNVESSSVRRLPKFVLTLFAFAAGVSVANIYCAQPLLEALSREFGFTTSSIGLVITVSQIGYALGLFFIVPLGDLLPRRRLVLSQLFLSALALTGVSFAASKSTLLVSMFLVGLLAVVVQVLVAFAASLASPDERGRAVGTVTGGIVLGILLARSSSGILSDLAGWRSVYLISGIIMLLLVAVLYSVLPESRSEIKTSYPELLWSVLALYRSLPVLRVRALIALLLFTSFATLWTPLVLPLSEPPHLLSRTAIGLFGLAGVVGAAAARHAGRLADQGRGQWTTGTSLGLLLISWVFIAGLQRSLLLLTIGIVLLDFAVQAVHVTSQSILFAACPEAKSRLVAAYMIFYSIGSGIGSLASTQVYSAFHWRGVCLLGASLSTAALGLWAFTLKPVQNPIQKCVATENS